MFKRLTNRRFWMFAAPLGAVSILAIPLAFAGHGWKGWGGCDGRGGHGKMTAEEARDKAGHVAERVLDKLDGTEEQEAQVSALLDQVVPGFVAHRDEAKALKAQFREALSVDQPDPAELEKLRSEALALADKASRQAVDSALQLHKVLTPEQRQKLLDWRGKRRRDKRQR